MGPSARGPALTSSELKEIANQVMQAGAPALPTIVLVRELPIFEVEFATLEFAEEVKVPASDLAVLSLAKALGEVTAADLDAYLGLGETLSELLLARLLEEELLRPRDEVASEDSPKTGVLGFLGRLFGGKATAAPAPTGRLPTGARALRDSRASPSPVGVVSPAGAAALEKGAMIRRRVRPARALFLSEPLLFLETVDEKRHRYAQYQRPAPLAPAEVPAPFHQLDETLGLPPDERLAQCGVGPKLGGLPGQFVGIVPGAQWEVRAEQHTAALVLAGFPSSDIDGLRWRLYLRRKQRVRDTPFDPARVIDPKLRSLSGVWAITLNAVAPELRPDGAFGVRRDEHSLTALLGDSDLPTDTYLSANALGWDIGLRAHACPADEVAARAAFFEFLGRRNSGLRDDFDGVCAAVAASLQAYWGEQHLLPSADAVAAHLWARPDLRAALCKRRLRADLVEAYLARETPQ